MTEQVECARCGRMFPVGLPFHTCQAKPTAEERLAGLEAAVLGLHRQFCEWFARDDKDCPERAGAYRIAALEIEDLIAEHVTPQPPVEGKEGG